MFSQRFARGTAIYGVRKVVVRVVRPYGPPVHFGSLPVVLVEVFH
jgi:hypothetical protein